MKRASAFVLCLALLLALALPAGAQFQPGFFHHFAALNGTDLLLAGVPTQEGTITVTVNGQSFSHYQHSTLEDSGLSVTYYCIVDQSSSLSNFQKEQQKQGLLALSSAMRPVDRMVVVCMSSRVSVGELLEDEAQRKQAISGACEYTARTTSLNSSLATAMEKISQAQDDVSLNTVVLFTDGLDDGQVSLAREKVTQAIQDSGLSLSTVALLDPWADQFSKNNANQLGLYAADSLGGIAKNPTAEHPDTASDVKEDVEEIVRQVLSGTVLVLDTTQLPTGLDSLEVSITGQADGTAYTDSYSVDPGLLRAIPAPTEPETVPPTQPETTAPTQPETTEATQPETTAPTEPETTEAPQPKTPLATEPETTMPTQPETTAMTIPTTGKATAAASQSSGKLLMLLVLAGSVVLAVLIILAVLLWRKQRALERDDRDWPEMDGDLPHPDALTKDEDFLSMDELKEKLRFDTGNNTDDFSLDVDLTIPAEMDAWTARPDAPILPPKPAPQKPELRKQTPPPRKDTTPGCRVRLVPDNHPEGVVEFCVGVNESITLGRNSRSAIVLNETDRALSSLHFELQWDSRVLHIRDRKSTNGTALNGVPLRAEVWTRVENKATIQAGSTRYTVLVEKK